MAGPEGWHKSPPQSGKAGLQNHACRDQPLPIISLTQLVMTAVVLDNITLRDQRSQRRRRPMGVLLKVLAAPRLAADFLPRKIRLAVLFQILDDFSLHVGHICSLRSGKNRFCAMTKQTAPES